MAKKPIDTMTLTEVRERLLEVDFEEEALREKVALVNCERAELRLALFRLEAKGGKK